MTDKLPLVVDPVLKQIREISAGEQLPAEILANALTLALTGLTTADSGVVTATDNLLQAIGKVQGQLNNKVGKDGSKVLSSNDFTNDERVKLANIADQATKNATDAALRDRSTHTGTQPIATVIGLQTALDTKADSTTVAQAITDAKARVNHTGPLNWAWATYGGTANTVTLAPAFTRTAYATGDEFRFRATATNTGATTINVNSLGAKTAVTVTGAALPAGYIRTGVDTVCVYDGTNFVVQREIEHGSNVNGDFVRLADGTQLCSHRIDGVVASNSTSVSNLYRSNSVAWTYPSGFASKVTVTHSEAAGIGLAWTSLGEQAIGITGSSVALYTFTQNGTATVSILATGRWY